MTGAGALESIRSALGITITLGSCASVIWRSVPEAGHPHHVGVMRSSDSGFRGIGWASVGGYVRLWHTDIPDMWARVGH
ncbi:MAG: hypothetical protein B5766_08160 [Candidatus Lumbricidophila eiseniae]|uniref:Uncharacterized protein n=1 Tax=Candidatus Lumbricidiphila eiseniae TaxID=1969409 RepID=A0A2A6FR60_9MICO|nr:MAG: hypothetical protein B5766_08160 [Candidatus Lumbricidophila eiseniae]